MVMSCKGCKFPAEAWAEAPGLGNRPCGGLLNFIMGSFVTLQRLLTSG